MNNRKGRKLMWQALLAVGLLLELGLIVYAIVALLRGQYQIHAVQQIAFVAILVWIYIAYLKQRSLDISAHLVDEKIKAHSLIESLQEGIILTDPDDTILLINERAAKKAGMDELGGLGRDLKQVAPDTLRAMLVENRAGEITATFPKAPQALRISVTPLPSRSEEAPCKLIRLYDAPAPATPAAPAATGPALDDTVEELARLLLLPPGPDDDARTQAALRALFMVESGKQRLPPGEAMGVGTAVNVRRLMAEVMDELRACTRRMDYKFEESGADAIGPVQGLRGTLQALLRLLLLQALAASSKGAVIKIKWGGMGDNVALMVCDTGLSVAPAEAATLFDEAGVPRPGGRLNLHALRQLVESQNGSIWAEAAPGGGVRVSLMLPGAVTL